MTQSQSTDAALHLAALTLDISVQANPADMATRVAGVAAKMVTCAAADIVTVSPTRVLTVVASSDPVLSTSTQRAWSLWPHSPESQIGSEHREPRPGTEQGYREQLRRDTGVVDEVLVALEMADVRFGHLRYLFTKPDAVTDDVLGLITAFSAHASVALHQAALQETIDNLRIALNSSRQIGAAIGVLMAGHGITYDEAFERLRAVSQNSNRKLRDIADDVVYTGTEAGGEDE